MLRRLLIALVALSCFAALAGPSAYAQAPAAPAVPGAAIVPPTSMNEFQGASCLIGGVAATAVTAAATRGLVPLAIAAVAGCAIGWLGSPSLLAAWRKVQ